MKFHNLSRLNVKVGDTVYNPYYQYRPMEVTKVGVIITTPLGNYNILGIDTLFIMLLGHEVTTAHRFIIGTIPRIYEIL